MSYRSVNFRDSVLFELARMVGLDPDTELLRDQAKSYAGYINKWVRKTWDAVDWPEWTKTQSFTPNANHIVPYTIVTTPSVIDPELETISRVFKMYLRDPGAVPGVLGSPFTLRPEGIHCGFEHGSLVWLKFISQAPQFSGEEWDVTRSYNHGDLVYSPVTGECYRSLINSNRGNDPAAGEEPPNVLQSQVLQEFTPDSPATSAQDEIWKFQVDVNTWYNLIDTTYHIVLADSQGMYHDFGYTTPSAGLTISDIMDGLIAAAGAGDAFSQSLTFTKDIPNGDLYISLSTEAFSNVMFHPVLVMGQKNGSDIKQNGLNEIIAFPATETQKYSPGNSAVPSVPQITEVTLQPATWVSGATYEVVITEPTNVQHTVTYQSNVIDGKSDVVNGVIAGFSGDEYLQSVVITPDLVNMKLTLATVNQATIHAQVVTIVSPKWLIVPFPFALVDAVLRGAYSDALKELGQIEKAAPEEQAVAVEASARSGAFMGPPFDKLTDQQQPKPHYQDTP